MYDVIIIGAGPAGITAALYTKRSNLKVLVLYNGISNVEKAEKIDNYYGFPNGIVGKDLFENGIKQAINLGIDIKKQEVTGVEFYEKEFKVNTVGTSYNCKSVIIATGNKKNSLNIKGIKEFEGKGISYCAICDGFFYKNKKIAIIGNGEFAISEANILKNVTNQIILLTNGEKLGEKSIEFNVNSNKIKEIIGNEKVSGIIFEDGTKIDVDGVFIALGEAGANDFAKTLGIITEGENIKVNENMETNIKGIYACGNAIGGLLQICKSGYDGAVAGLSVVKYLKNFIK